jgi:hypothetical protein
VVVEVVEAAGAVEAVRIRWKQGSRWPMLALIAEHQTFFPHQQRMSPDFAFLHTTPIPQIWRANADGSSR